ncbi:hypothetical protein AGMMS50229_15180 [Campylobacterota bacterium]|nr:hypothetical protein AGMMS50229_15180 [Campylobacterota bacterium]
MSKGFCLVALLIVALLAGCSGRSAFFDFTGSTAYAQALPYTKRGEISDRFDSKALITASYLNMIYPQKYTEEAEYFFVGLYIANDYAKDKAGINNPQYSLTLNGAKYLSAKEIDKNDELVKLMPMVNRWSRYYLVTFAPSTEVMQLSLDEYDTNRSVSLAFSKESQE